MNLDLLVPFLVIVAVASYVQTVTGFALGMIIVGVVTSLDMATIAYISVIISLVTLSNGAFALLGALHHVDWRAVRAVTLGLLPAIVVGVLLLDYLSATAASFLQLLLGAVIIAGALHVMMWPDPRPDPSGNRGFFVSGALGGLLSGMFAIAGPPLIYQFYRQPLPLVAIRKSLILLFSVASLSRLLFIGAQGGVNAEMVLLSLAAMPVVAVATLAGRRYPPPFSETTMRRVAFVMLSVIGGSLVVSAIPSLGIWMP